MTWKPLFDSTLADLINVLAKSGLSTPECYGAACALEAIARVKMIHSFTGKEDPKKPDKKPSRKPK